MFIQREIYLSLSVPWQQGDDCGKEPLLPEELPHGGRHDLQDLVGRPQVFCNHVDETGACKADWGGLESGQVEKLNQNFPCRRLSVFFTTRVDGVLEIWDFLYQQKGPILPVKVADYPLLSMKVCDGRKTEREFPFACWGGDKKITKKNNKSFSD